MTGIDKQILDLSEASTKRGLALDRSYKWMVFSPIAAVAGYLLALGLQ